MRIPCLFLLGCWFLQGVASPRLPRGPTPLDGAVRVAPQPLLGWDGGTDVLTNGGFEENLTGWLRETTPSGAGFVVVRTNFQPLPSLPLVLPVEGRQMAVLRGFEPGRVSLSRELVIPETPGPVFLAFSDWVNARSSRGSFRGSYAVGLWSYPAPGFQPVLLQSLRETVTNSTSQGWARRVTDVSKYAGQTLRWVATGQMESGVLDVLLDDVRLITESPDGPEYEVRLGEDPELGPEDLIARTRSPAVAAPVLRPGDTNYWQVIARDSTGVQAGPVWSFVAGPSGAASQILWDRVDQPMFAGVPSPVEFSVRDAAGTETRDFNGTVRLTALTAGTNAPRLLITGLQYFLLTPGRGSVQLSNVGTNQIRFAGWKLTVWDQARWPAPATTLTLPASATLAAGRSAYLGAGSSGFPLQIPLGVPLYWGRADTNQLAAALLQDTNGVVVDFVAAGGADLGSIQSPVPIPPWHWIGPSLPRPVPPEPGAVAVMWERVARRDTHSAADWGIPAGSGLTLNVPRPMDFSPVGREVFPVEVDVSQGRWSGTVTIPAAGEILELVAHSPAGPIGRRVLAVRPDAPIRIDLPDRLQEDAGTVSAAGRIILPETTPVDLSVALTVTPAGHLEIPPSVLIPAGSREGTFAVTALDDTLREGSVPVMVQATAAGLAGQARRIWVDDSEVSALSLQLPAGVREGDTTAGCWVVANPPPDRDTQVRIEVNGSPTESWTQEVWIPAGQQRAPFRFSVPDNTRLDGGRTMTVRARVVNWSDQPGTIRVTDDDSPTLALAKLVAEVESDRSWTNAGKVTLGGSVETNVVVRLTSSDPSRVRVPLQVEVPAGQREVPFDLTLLDNATVEGEGLIVISAEADGFVRTETSLFLEDNDAAGFVFDPVASPQRAEREFPVTVTALGAQGEPVEWFRGPWTFHLLGAGAPVPVQPLNTVFDGQGRATVWFSLDALGTGFRLAVDDGRGHRAESGPFELIEPPYRRFPGLVSDVASDPASARLHVAVRGGDAAGGTNRLVTLDPETRQEFASVELDRVPVALFISEGGEFLYATAGDGSQVRQYRLPSLEEVRRWNVVDESGAAVPVEDLAVQPGQPEVVALTRQRTGVSPRAHGVVVYDRGIPRERVLDAFNQRVNRVEFSPAGDVLFGYENETSAYAFVRMAVDAGGVSLLDRRDGATTTTFGLDFHRYADALVFGDGDVQDPVAGSVRRLPFWNPPLSVATETARQRVFGLGASGLDSQVSAFDFVSGRVIGTEVLVGLYSQFGQTTRLVRWGDRGLAALVEGSLAYWRSPLVPPGEWVDAALSLGAAPEWIAGRTNELSLVVSNRLSGPIQGLRLVLPWQESPIEEPEVVWAGRVLTRSRNPANEFEFTLGDVPAGAVVQLRVRFRPIQAGSMSLPVEVWADAPEADRANNRLVLEPNIEFRLARGTGGSIRVQVDSLVGNEHQAALWAGQGLEKRLIELDPFTGRVRRALPLELPAPYDVLALSDDGSRLYVASREGNAVVVVDPVAWKVVRRILLGETLLSSRVRVSQIVVRPGAPEDAAVLLAQPNGGSIALSGVIWMPGGRVVPQEHESTTTDHLSFSADGRFLDAPGWVGRRWAVGADGLVEVSPRGPLLDGAVGDYALVNDRVYFAEEGSPEALVPLGQFPFFFLGRGRTVMVPEAGMMFLRSLGSVRVIDLATLTWVTELKVPRWNSGETLVRWAHDGLAWAGESGINVQRTDWLPEVVEPADVAVSLETPGYPTEPDGSVVVQISVQNRGPGLARSLQLNLSLPPDVAPTFSNGFEPPQFDSPESFDVPLGDLAAGASTPLTLRLKRGAPGVTPAAMPLGLVVRSEAPDPVRTNQTARAVVAWPQKDPGWQLLGGSLDVRDARWDAVHRRFWLSVGMGAGSMGNGVVGFDPVTQRFGTPRPVGSLPGHLALAEDASRLYVALDGGAEVVVLGLPDLVELDRFPLGPAAEGGRTRIVYDALVVPGQPTNYVASLWLGPGVSQFPGAGIAFYRNGQKTPNEALVPQVTSIEPGLDGTRFWAALTSFDPQFYSLRSDESGLTLDPLLGTLNLPWGELATAGDWLVGGNGALVHRGTGQVEGPLGFPDDSGTVVPIPPRYLVCGEPGGTTAYALPTFQPIRVRSYQSLPSMTFSGSLGDPPPLPTPVSSLQRWGVDGFSYFSTAGWIFFRSDAAEGGRNSDWDGDGLPDFWEQKFGTDSHVADAGADPDGDGLDNAGEWAAGTLPNDAGSRFEWRLTATETAGWQGEVQGRFGRRYQVQSSDSLAGPWVPWGAPFDGQESLVSIALPAPEGTLWFRVVLVTP